MSNLEEELLDEILKLEQDKYLQVYNDYCELQGIKCFGTDPEIDVLQQKFLKLSAEIKELEKTSVPKILPGASNKSQDLSSSVTNAIPNNNSLLCALLMKHLSGEVKSLEDLSKHQASNKNDLLKKGTKLLAMITEEQKLYPIIKEEYDKIMSSEMEPDVSHSYLSKLETKYENVRMLRKERIGQLRRFLTEYFSIPANETMSEDSQFDVENATDLSYIIEKLFHSHNNSDPWVEIDSSMSLSHIELLCRTQLIQRHPQNNTLIKIKPFN